MGVRLEADQIFRSRPDWSIIGGLAMNEGVTWCLMRSVDEVVRRP
jgi:hypothetical protein